MWLINVKTKNLHEFGQEADSKIPEYAILSHVWVKGSAELLFRHLNGFTSKSEAEQTRISLKEGWWKIERACLEASRDKYDWLWTDSCCINRDCPSEWSITVKSMFEWYKAAAECYVYLGDVVKVPRTTPAGKNARFRFKKRDFQKSQWFTRIWTLLALIAPSSARIFDKRFEYLGDRSGLKSIISRKTGINNSILERKKPLNLKGYSVARRMSWASGRSAVKPENDREIVFSLMGFFEVSMPYDPGEDLTPAFERLQMKILKTIPDQSLFAWQPQGSRKFTKSTPPMAMESLTKDGLSLFAKSPADFGSSANIVPREQASLTKEINVGGVHARLRIEPMPYVDGFYLGILNCADQSKTSPRVAILLEKLETEGKEDKYVRHETAPMLEHKPLK